MRPFELIDLKRDHIRRLANENGAKGEATLLASDRRLLKRPVGRELHNILVALSETGINIRKTSFDALSVPDGSCVDLANLESVRGVIQDVIFFEIKTANQKRVKSDFSGFFFAFTEGELLAAEALGTRHRVILLNKVTGDAWETTVKEILDRAKSTNWQVSIQL